MRKVFAPVVPACSLCAAMIAILIVAVPVVKVLVEFTSRALGY